VGKAGWEGGVLGASMDVVEEKCRAKRRGEFQRGKIGQTSGEWMTWIEEDGAQLLGSSPDVLNHREACSSGEDVMVVHRNIEGSTLQIGIHGIVPEALAATPRNL
jgi:hypothetical protein